MDNKNKYERIGVIISALALIVTVLVFVFGNGVIWRGASNDLDSSSPNMIVIEKFENDNNTENNTTTSSGVEGDEAKNNSTENSSVGNDEAGSNSDVDNIKCKVWLKDNQNISNCPQVVIPVESNILGRTTYDLMWKPFKGAIIYRISVWKDANYETSDSDIIIINEVEVSGLSYSIDLTALESGYTYGYNVVVDNHYSSPLLIELY